MEGKLAAGLGAFSAYGTDTQWPGDGPLRYVITNSRLSMVIYPQRSLQGPSDDICGCRSRLRQCIDAMQENHVNMNDLNGALSIQNGTPTAFTGFS